MSTIPGLGPLLTTVRCQIPYKSFHERLKCLDYAGQILLLRTVRKPFVLPSRQLDFPTTQELRTSDANENPNPPFADYAFMIERAKARRDRFEASERERQDATKRIAEFVAVRVDAPEGPHGPKRPLPLIVDPVIAGPLLTGTQLDLLV